MPKVVKPGSIENPDRLFNDLGKEILDKYISVGKDLGLSENDLKNELNSGMMRSMNDNLKATKMLHLWQQSVPEEEFTYEELATALKKNKLGASADKYCCYTPDPEPPKRPTNGAGGSTTQGSISPVDTPPTPGAAGPATQGQEEPLYSLRADAPENALPKPTRGTPQLKCLKEFASEVAIILHTTVSPSEKPAVLKDMTAPELDPPVAGPINLLNTPNKIILGMFGGYKCALVQTEQGEKCKNEIEDALEQLPNTQFVIALGMAYGSTKYTFGDVLVSKTIRGVVNPKFKGECIDIRSSEYDSVPVLDKLSKLFASDLHNWKDFRCSTDRISKAYAGDVISVSWLISSKSIRDSLLSNFPDAIGGEMEGHELVEIQKDYNKHNHPRQLGVIIIKGAADYADENKQGGKKWQYTAARAATSFAKYKLESTKGTLFDSDQDDKDDPQQTPGATGSK